MTKLNCGNSMKTRLKGIGKITIIFKALVAFIETI